MTLREIFDISDYSKSADTRFKDFQLKFFEVLDNFSPTKKNSKNFECP